MNTQWKKVELCVIKHAALENNRAYLLRKEIPQSYLNNRICLHCGVKMSTVTHSFYYVFNISLSCNNSIPSFIGNLWRVLLLGNHLTVWNQAMAVCHHPLYRVEEFRMDTILKMKTDAFHWLLSVFIIPLLSVSYNKRSWMCVCCVYM